MKLFLRKTFLVAMVPLLVFIIGLILPATPKARQSLLMSKFTKDSLFDNVPKPRIVFIAGSSMSLGLNSQVFKDSLRLNPINTGIHGGLGLFYMMDDALRHIKSGDIIVVCPEYHQFYGDFAEGGEELLREAFDTSSRDLILNLRWKQLLKIYPHVPKYAMSKFFPKQYFHLGKNDFYSKDAFNQYGDAVGHWKMHFDKPVQLFQYIEGGPFNEAIIPAITDFNKMVKAKGARMILSFPPFQESSFNNCRKQIDYVDKRLREIPNLEIVGTPKRYMMPDNMIFDTPYHLNKQGVDRRSRFLLEDVAQALTK